MIDDSNLLHDRRPVPLLPHGAVSVYVDKVGFSSTDVTRCRELTKSWLGAIRRSGLEAHEVEEAAEGG